MSIPNRIARLSSTGATDTSFDPGAGLNGEGLCVAVLPVVKAGETPDEIVVDHVIVAGGNFTEVDGEARSRLVVLNADGSLVETELAADAQVRMLLGQTDGRVILGGDFTTLNDLPRGRLARLTDGFLVEEIFDPVANNTVHAGALQTDGKVMVGGSFTQLGPTPVTHQYLARLFNDETAVSELKVLSAGRVEWRRGVTCQEAERVSFDLSTDGGSTWTALGGKISRTGQGWQLVDDPSSDLTLSGAGKIRGRAYLGTGRNEGVQETIYDFSFVPIMVVQCPPGTVKEDDDEEHPVGFSEVQIGKSLAITVAIRNEGLEDLNLTGATLGGTLASHFSVTVPDAFDDPLPSGQTITLTVRFAPTIMGGKTAYLEITGDDPVQASFKLHLTGIGVAGPGAPEPTYYAPAINGDYSVYAMAYGFDSTALMIGGDFTTVNAKTRNRIASMDPNGNLLAQAGGGIATAKSGVYCSAALPNGKYLIGGDFPKGLARLNANGSVDTTFKVSVTAKGNTSIMAYVVAMAVQADGSIIIGGMFTHAKDATKAGAKDIPHSNVARLNPDGTLDVSWNPAIGSEFDYVRALALQEDGKLLVGGKFGSAASGKRRGVARLNSDGTLDSTFDAKLSISAHSVVVRALAVQQDGGILIGGEYDHIGETVVARGISRVSAEGAFDDTFTTIGVQEVYSMVLQCDGKVIMVTSGTERIRRVQPKGENDTDFVPVAREGVRGVALDGSGNVMVGGNFLLNSKRYSLAKLKNGPAASCVLAVTGSSEVKWTRSDTAPETQVVNFELSQNGGATWTPLGAATRSVGGVGAWVLSDLVLPISGMIRGLARTQGGFYNGSNGVHEQRLVFAGRPAPDISVTPTGAIIGGHAAALTGRPLIPNNGSQRIDGELPTRPSTMILSIRNIGRANLTALTASIAQTKPKLVKDSEWSIDSLSRTVIRQNADGTLPDDVATLNVTFTPGAATKGEHEATLTLKSNVPGVNGNYVITLQSRTLALPAVSTNTAALAGNTQATLKATVRPNHDKAYVYFMFKQAGAPNYIKITMEDIEVSGSDLVDVSYVLTGLTRSTQYHAYAVIYNAVNPPEKPFSVGSSVSTFITTNV